MIRIWKRWWLFLLSLLISIISLILAIFFKFPFLFVFAIPPIICSKSVKENEVEEETNFCSECGYLFQGFEQYCPLCGYPRKKLNKIKFQE
ncbi:MAG: hypothetical protein ACTSQE_01685 [Candidatus Heimdallarchaeaceae archaeon]